MFTKKRCMPFSTTEPVMTEFFGDFRESPGFFLLVYFASSIHVPLTSYRHSSPLKNQFRYMIGVMIVVSRLIKTSTTQIPWSIIPTSHLMSARSSPSLLSVPYRTRR